MADETHQTDVARYAAAVRAELVDLPGSERDALIDDLEDHLAEVVAESGQPLELRLGSPEAYAAELRAAYAGSGRGASRRRLRRLRHLAEAATLHVSGWRSYQAIREYLPELRPAWWILRAYLAVIVLAVMLRGDQEIHPVPNPFTSGGLVEIVAMLGAIVFSVRLGRWAARRDGSLATWWLRGANALVVMTGLLALGTMSTGPTYDGSQTSAGGVPDAYAAGPLTNIYPYTADGKPLQGVLLYDQDGRPLMVTSIGDVVTQYPIAADGQPVLNEYPLTQTRVEDGSRVVAPRVPVPPVAPTPSPTPSPNPSGSPGH